MSRRFERVELTDWRSRLIDSHPRLFPDAEPKSGATGQWLCSAGWPFVEDGWREVTERLCRRLDSVARRDAVRVAIISVDEKFAEMRIEVACEGLDEATSAEVANAVALAEARSGLTCGICGERGTTWDRGGWLIARCDQHGEGIPNRCRYGPMRITYRQDGDRIVSNARSYDFERDTFVAAKSTEI